MSNVKFIDTIVLDNGHELQRHVTFGYWELWVGGVRTKRMREFEQTMIDASIRAGIDYTKGVR